MRLKTKFTLWVVALVLALVAAVSAVHVARLTGQVVREADERARFITQQVFLQAQHALEDAAEQGAAPRSESLEDLREYVREALEENVGLTSLIDATVGYSATVYEVSITDHRGVAIISSDASLHGREAPRHPPLETLTAAGVVAQLRVLYGPPRVYQVALPFNLGEHPFGEIRVALQTAFLRNQIQPALRRAGEVVLAAAALSALLAAVASHFLFAPLGRISAQLDQLNAGQFDLEPIARADEFGQVSTKITQVGHQLRGVREIFSTLRDNLNHLMAGLDDGLLLFGADGRAVLASPSVEKFLGLAPEAVLGRGPAELFPQGHPLRQALRLEGQRLAPLPPTEVSLPGPRGPRRARLSVQAVEQQGGAGGALLLLRDVESLERIGSHLAASERLSALGRITAGVAHEVKNPLNSMRLWLENLKESLPAARGGEPGGEMPQTAVKVLDSEIDRLDRVVKTFLNFTRPVELRLAETRLDALLREVLTIARPQLERAGVAVETSLDAALPAARVDPSLLKQAVLNLVFNACEVLDPARRGATASPGKLSLTLRAARGGSPAAEILVADNGPGISPEHRPRIFQLFFTTRGASGGTGIGLATTFRIVQLHGGSIDFETETGRGTTFRIELPLAAPVAAGQATVPADAESKV